MYDKLSVTGVETIYKRVATVMLKHINGYIPAVSSVSRGSIFEGEEGGV